MCILFLYNGANDVNSDYSLILASNRDEYYDRPTQNMAPWSEDPCVIGGGMHNKLINSSQYITFIYHTEMCEDTFLLHHLSCILCTSTSINHHQPVNVSTIGT